MKKQLDTIRHSTAHLMASAIFNIYPDAKFGIGPDIENGFYYDIEFKKQITEQDLKKIEKEMEKLQKQNLKFEKKEIKIDEAINLFKKLKQDYKVELLKDLKNRGTTAYEEIYRKDNQKSKPKNKLGKVTIYKTGKFIDLCQGPHVSSTGEIKIFKLTKMAGAYWRGNEKNKMLTRIYGTAFEDKKSLAEYLKFLQEAEKRDHKKLGKDLDLFLIDPTVGLGLVMWQPKGAILWKTMEDFWYKEHLKNGYQLVRSPHIGSRVLWETSGHWGFYNESMYPPLEVGQTLKETQEGKKSKIKEEYLLKPMNCPFHVTIYKSKPKSYRDLPIRWAECGTVYRYEKSGELSGLTRVRGFTQDDAHIICAKDQAKNELKKVADFILYILKTFGFKEFNVYLSLRDPDSPKKYAGNDEGWKFTEKILEEVAKEQKLNYKKEVGEAAFYGPKLDYKIKDCIGREWQCSTLQFDFNLPERFDMTFTNKKGKKERPFVLHRALFGSFERFIGILIEHYAGSFPAWLAPVQVAIFPVSAKKHSKGAEKLAKEFRNQGVRVWVGAEDESIGKKVREAEKQKIPFILVFGDKEAKSKKLNVRQRGKSETSKMEIKEIIEKLKRL